MSTERLRQRDVERPFYGVYRRLHYDDAVTDSLESAHERWQARQLELARSLLERLPPDVYFSGRTAAAIWKLPVPAYTDDALELVRLSPARALRVAGVTCNRVEPKYVSLTRYDGLPVVSAASTWCLLAPQLAWHDGVTLGDGVVRRARIPGTQRLERAPHATVEDLRLFAELPRRRNAARLLSMLPSLSTQSASAPETHLRLALEAWQAPEPTLDHDVYGSNGRLLGCSEVAWPEFRLALEYEGDHHRTNYSQWNRDLQKYSDYRRAGWEVIRVTSQLLYRRSHELRAETFEFLTKRGWSGSR